MLEKNTKQVNRMLARIYARCTAAILVLVLCSSLGIFEFGRNYTMLILVAGLLLAITPSILIRYLPDNVMKYYMLILVSIFIGILGTNNHIGVYITYILVPVFSCLYFEPHRVIKMGVFSYIVMAVSIYISIPHEPMKLCIWECPHSARRCSPDQAGHAQLCIQCDQIYRLRTDRCSDQLSGHKRRIYQPGIHNKRHRSNKECQNPNNR